MTRRKASGQPKRKRRPPPPRLTPQRNKPHAPKPAASQRFTPTDAHGGLPMWIDQQGLHLVLPGDQPDPQLLQRLSETLQQKLRDSPLYRQLVDAYGPAEAEKIIQQCRVELR